ncbi:MAG: bifunctional diaminohydroxyphosphoribosylaminopyrimidine deaminase/5-amino-6-(5-phosphoribosylamino)uracil reductase RibD [Verrucomicrobiota bacterium]
MSLAVQDDERFMAHAIELARQAWGRTHPNPMVGAVVADAGKIIAEGWHKAAGQPHAEVEALASLAEQPSENASLYVTLEPCSTCGRTGACTKAIIKSGIRRVVIGAVDPNPEHAGAGLDILRNAGIEVVSGVLENKCADLNLIFNHWIVDKTPFIASKMAMTLDGKFAASSGHSQWVTAEAAREDVMHWRRYFPAIAVGANTIIKDDPSLTSRIKESVFCPTRFVFDRHLKTADCARLPRLYSDQYKNHTVVLCLKSADRTRKKAILELGLALWELNEEDGHLDWSQLRQLCAQEGIIGIYVESGPTLATELIENRKVDYLFIYKAPKFMADSVAPGIGSKRGSAKMSDAFELLGVHHEIFGDDVLIRGRLAK